MDVRGRNAAAAVAAIFLATMLVPGHTQVKTEKVCAAEKENATCMNFDLMLECGVKEKIFFLDTQQGFQYKTSGDRAETCGDSMCSETCCQKDNFRCSKSSSVRTFSQAFAFCWNEEARCTTSAPRDNGSFEFSGQADCNREAQYSELAYVCVNDSAIQTLGQEGSVEGATVVAKYSPAEPADDVTKCEGGMSMQCDVTGTEETDASVSRVMLVLYYKRFSGKGPCASLEVTDKENRTFSVQCSEFATDLYAPFLTLHAQSTPLQISLIVTSANLPSQAWAVLQGEQSLKLQCNHVRCRDYQERTTGATENTTGQRTEPPLSSTSSSERDAPAEGNTFPMAQVVGGAAGGLIFIAVIAFVVTSCYQARKSKLPQEDGVEEAPNAIEMDMGGAERTLEQAHPSVGQPGSLEPRTDPDDAVYDYDRLGQKSRPLVEPGGVYGHLGRAGVEGGGGYDYGTIGKGKVKGAGVLTSNIYGHLDMAAVRSGHVEEGGNSGAEDTAENNYDHLGCPVGADVIKDGIYDAAGEV